MICNNCGVENPKEARYCKECGYDLSEPEDSVTLKKGEALSILDRIEELERELKGLKVVFDIRVDEFKRSSRDIKRMKEIIERVVEAQKNIKEDIDSLKLEFNKLLERKIENVRNGVEKRLASFEKEYKDERKDIEFLKARIKEHFNTFFEDMKRDFRNESRKLEYLLDKKVNEMETEMRAKVNKIVERGMEKEKRIDTIVEEVKLEIETKFEEIIREFNRRFEIEKDSLSEFRNDLERNMKNSIEEIGKRLKDEIKVFEMGLKEEVDDLKRMIRSVNKSKIEKHSKDIDELNKKVSMITLKQKSIGAKLKEIEIDIDKKLNDFLKELTEGF